METTIVHTNNRASMHLPRMKRTAPVHDDLNLDNNEFNICVETELEEFFARQRGLAVKEPLPEGCISLEDSYRRSINRLKERYA